MQQLLAEKNSLSKEIGALKSKNQETEEIINKVETLKNKINSLKELQKIKDDELKAILSRIHNIIILVLFISRFFILIIYLENF